MRSRIRVPVAVAFVTVLSACGGGSPSIVTDGITPQAIHASASRWIPAPGDTYQIQYDGSPDPDFSVQASIYDVDMFDTPKPVVAKIHSMGRRAVCYVDVGTWENWRPDAKEFPKSVLGKPDGGWKGERWLDIRQTKILEPIMTHRLQLCKEKGFDAVDPDNLDGYVNDTGFHLTYAEQLAYDTWVAQEAHALGLTAAEKGDNNQVNDLVKVYDYAVVEQCYMQGWCNQFAPYTQTNRLVVDVEYNITQQRFVGKACPDTAKYHESAMLKKLELTAWIVTCAQ